MLSHQFHSHGRVVVQLNRLEANRLGFSERFPGKLQLESAER
jgi:hypothetical protein